MTASFGIISQHIICLKLTSFFFYYSRPSIVLENSLVLGVVQISKSFGLVNAYIFNGAYSLFHLMHHKILMNIVGFGDARVRIKGIRINEGLL